MEEPEHTFNTDGAAPHFYTRRPVHICTDDIDDEGPPHWRILDDIDWLSGTGRWGQ